MDFESDSNRGGCPDGFHNYMHPPNSASYTSDTAVFHTPPRSTKIVLRDDARGTQSVTLPAHAGRKYVVSAWAKTDFTAGGSAYIYVQWQSKSGKLVLNQPQEAQLVKTSDWTQLTQQLTAPEKAEALSFVMVATRKGKGEATVWFDDPRVVEVGADGAQTALLPMELKVPASAEQARTQVRDVVPPLEALLASVRKGSDAGPLCQQVLARAQEVAQKADLLRKEDTAYANVVAALDTCAARLGRAANILNGWRMTLAGGGPVAKGDSPQFTVELAGGSLAVKNLAFDIKAPEGWDVSPVPPAANLAAGETVRVSFGLVEKPGAQPGGKVVVTVSGVVERGHAMGLERQASFEIVSACRTALAEQGQDEGGRVQRLLLSARNMRKGKALPITVTLAPASGFTSPWREKTADIKPGEEISIPIALTAGEGEKTGWRETMVTVAWDGEKEVHRLLLLYVPPSANLLQNGGMEQGTAAEAAPWSKDGPGGYSVDAQVKHSGAGSLHVVNTPANRAAGASQRVVLNQKVPRPLVLRGWSLCRRPGGGAEEIKTIGQNELVGPAAGSRSGNYSLYADLHYVSGGALYGQTATFDKSAEGWQFSQAVIAVAKPVKDVTVYLLFRDQEGEAWFDDVYLAEADPDLALTPGAKVLTDSCTGGYTPQPLIDGVVDTKGVEWSQAAWASADGPGEHWAEIVLPEAVPVKTVVIYWAVDNGTWTSRKYSVRVFVDGAWRNVAEITGAQTETDFSVHAFDPVKTNRIRILQPEGGGPPTRPLILWLREIEVF